MLRRVSKRCSPCFYTSDKENERLYGSMADVMNKPFSEVAKMMGETGDAPSDPNDINIDDLAYAIWDKAAPDDYEDQINIAFC